MKYKYKASNGNEKYGAKNSAIFTFFFFDRKIIKVRQGKATMA